VAKRKGGKRKAGGIEEVALTVEEFEKQTPGINGALLMESARVALAKYHTRRRLFSSAAVLKR
jgi:hypothetical protein